MVNVGSLLDAFATGTKASKTAWKSFSATWRSLDSATFASYSKAMSTALSTADPSIIKRFAAVADDDAIATVLRNADNDVAEALVKNMDDAALARVAAVDPALARNLGFGNVVPPTIADVAIKQGDTAAQAAKVSQGATAMQKSQVAVNAGKTKTVPADAAKTAPLSATDDAAEQTAVTWVRNKAGVVESVSDADLAEAIRNGGEIVKNSGTVRKALEKLGIIAVGSDIATFTRKHWMKMGAAMVILCMAYDTNNPFTALDRALEDIDDMVDGLKDLSEAAGNAAKNVAKGGFDFLAFITENWWMSLICCLAMVFIGVAATLS
jgi:hypothetical protein